MIPVQHSLIPPQFLLQIPSGFVRSQWFRWSHAPPRRLGPARRILPQWSSMPPPASSWDSAVVDGGGCGPAALGPISVLDSAQPRPPSGPPPSSPSCSPTERFLSPSGSPPEIFPPHNAVGGTYDLTSHHAAPTTTYSVLPGPPPLLSGPSRSGIIDPNDPYLWRPPDPDYPDDLCGTFDAPSQQAVSTPSPEGVGGDQPDFLPPEVDISTATPAQDDAERQAGLAFPGWPYPHQEIVVAATAAVPSGTVGPRWSDWGDQPSFFPPGVDSRNATAAQLEAEEAARLDYPGWGPQPNFLPPGVNGWTATAFQCNAERVALLDWQADQAPIRIAVLAYEARGRKIHQALRYATAWGLEKPPPQGAIRGCAKIKPLFEYSAGAMHPSQEGSARLMLDSLAQCPETMVLVNPGSFSARMPKKPPLPHPWNRGPEYDMYASGIDLDPGPSAREHVERRSQARKRDAFNAHMEHTARNARRARRAHPCLWGTRACTGPCTPLRN